MKFKRPRIIYNYWTTIFIPSYLRFNYYRLFKSIKPLKFQGEEYKYFYHWYNTTWNNERAVEIPVVCKLMDEYKYFELLEIGNVLSHYFKLDHDVVDKYEKANGVINEDVVEFHPSKKYDLIISISTLEHVGWDETPKDPNKILVAIENLKNLLMSGGKLIITVPIGLNLYLDKFLETGKVKFNENYYFKRISPENEWIELGSDFSKAKLNHPFASANVLFLGIYHKD